VRALVVNWNGAHLLPACLASLAAQTYPGLEVVVVDNASTDGSAEVLAGFPDVRVLRSDRNRGFAGGVALGVDGYDGDFVVLLNNDATFEPDAVAALVAAAGPAASRVGAVTARLLLGPRDQASPRLVNSTGNVVTVRGTGGDRDWLAPLGTESTDPDVFGFCGGAALLRASALREVGGFDADLFLYYEDTDVSWRLRAAGWTVRYAPEAVGHHLHAASSDEASPLFRYYNTRNSLVVFGRHAPAAVWLGSLLRQTAGALRTAVRSGPRDPQTRARARALRDALRRLPRTLAERRRIWRGAAVPRAEVARLLSR
jgi:GT2 family glycosyltransferase